MFITSKPLFIFLKITKIPFRFTMALRCHVIPLSVDVEVKVVQARRHHLGLVIHVEANIACVRAVAVNLVAVRAGDAAVVRSDTGWETFDLCVDNYI